MSSVFIAGDTSGTVTISAPAVAGTPTLTLPTTSGTVVATSGGYVPTTQLGSGSASSSTYLRGDQSWATISSGGMTLLGTVNATSGNSVSLGSLSLSGYKELHIVATSIAHSGAATYSYVNSDNSQTTDTYTFFLRNAVASSGIAIINLSTGAFMSNSSQNSDPSSGAYVSGKLNITTATTTIYFRLSSTYTYTGSGTFLVYGVA